MKQVLIDHLKSKQNLPEDWTSYGYREDINLDALSDAWLEKRTSYIYKVGVLTAIDANKCDWVCIVIGMQRDKDSEVTVIGVLDFIDGENDDISRVIKRSITMLQYMHPVFDEIL
jgi:hypothetical protein